ncbi:NADH dehydrogenase [ubiquinone] iron-sulfur protein 5 [Phlebotomus argentipes]|uniref:NADH dehydrogenase [ubiquinone] iron-sulfur protein 5 n=1 Tax=Phlebotomus argentipes TaxID=94469 RepID=UPI002892D714|nr:NADH dehydrogenase [ubiquinone] iron-sulfur protein 5 [Phlebotomus argentipes]
MSGQPFLRNIFTDLTASIPNCQHYDKCGEREIDMMECLEAYGTDRGRLKCADLIHDFQECVGRKKQILRFHAMRSERHRQWWKGERSSEEHYAKAPRVDAY